MTNELCSARCTTRGCPVRYRGGADRPCPHHADDGPGALAARMEQYAGVLEAAPGDPLTLGDLASDDAGDDGPWHD